MKKLNLSLKMKIILSFGLILFLVISGCLSFVNRVGIMNGNTVEISQAMDSIDMSRNVQTNLLDINTLLLLSLDKKNQNLVGRYKEEIKELEKEDNELMERYLNIDSAWLDGEEELTEEFKLILGQYRKSRDEAIALVESKKYKEAYEKNILNESQSGLAEELNEITSEFKV